MKPWKNTKNETIKLKIRLQLMVYKFIHIYLINMRLTFFQLLNANTARRCAKWDQPIVQFDKFFHFFLVKKNERTNEQQDKTNVCKKIRFFLSYFIYKISSVFSAFSFLLFCIFNFFFLFISLLHVFLFIRFLISFYKYRVF